MIQIPEGVNGKINGRFRGKGDSERTERPAKPAEPEAPAGR